MRRRWGDEETAAEKVRRRRLEWLGHVARMSDHRISKSVLFGWLIAPGRWKDVVRRDLKDIDVEESELYTEARKAGGRCAG